MADLEILRRWAPTPKVETPTYYLAILIRKLYAYPQIGDANLEVYIMDV